MRYVIKLIVFVAFYGSLMILLPWWCGFILIHWIVSLFLHSFLLHRYATHEQYTMNQVMFRFFYLCAAVFQGTSFLPLNEYRVFHKVHHREADTPHDPHTPDNYDNVFAMMWDTAKGFHPLAAFRLRGDSLVNNPDLPQRITKEDYDKYSDRQLFWPSLEKIAYSDWVRLAWFLIYVLFYVVVYVYSEISLALYVYIPIVLLLVWMHTFIAPIQGALINWYGHKSWAGYRNSETPDKSQNITLGVSRIVMDIITMGEGPHNNHHADQKSPNFAKKWWEIDPTYLIMVLLHYMKIIQIKRSVDLTKT